MSSSRPARVVLFGASGRMGQAIRAVLFHEPRAELVGVAGRNSSGELEFRDCDGGSLSAAEVLEQADVAIDFTLPEAVEAHATLCGSNNLPYVCGVTGLSEQNLEALGRLSSQNALLWAPNMSTSVTVCFGAVADIAQRLGADVHVSITDIHHEAKKDAPSGTALEFGRVIAEASPHDVDIVYSSVREGAHPGEHHIVFQSGSDEIEVRHRAGDRAEFAIGAVRAARWLVEQPSGFYNMRNVLGITSS